MAPISPISNPSSDPPQEEPFVPSEQPDIYQEGFQEVTFGETTNDEEVVVAKVPSVLSTLPVALVVEQTARILEDIKRKIQLQKEEEERLKLEAKTDDDDSLMDLAIIRPIHESIRKKVFDDELFSIHPPKSFIILNSTTITQSSLSPTKITSNPRSLSSDSGTDYEPFSASSSISPPFPSTVKHTNSDFNYDVIKQFSNNSEDETFKALPKHSSFSPSKLPLSLTIPTTTTSSSVFTSQRRLSGIISYVSSVPSLTKSTPSISTDLEKELQQQQVALSASPIADPKPLLSFQVLRANTTSGLISNTYQERPTSMRDTSRYKSIPSLYGSVTAFEPSVISSFALSSQISCMLANNKSAFGDPANIKPIVSALECPPYKLSVNVPSSPVMFTRTFIGAEKHAKSFDDAATHLKTIENYEHMREKHKLHLELSYKQQQPDFLSLSLSPPMNRKNLSAFKALSL